MYTTVDVIIPIYNSPHLLRFCIESLKRTTEPENVRLILVLDGSDRTTSERTLHWINNRPNTTFIAQKNQGFVGACNAGLRESKADLAVLLNSDTCVTPGWLEKFQQCFRSDPKIGIASPISNFAPHNVVQMQPGLSYLEMAELVERLSDSCYPDITTPEGFCFAISRECIRKIGILDPVFGRGYCEESDLSIRANYFGFRTVCVDNCYIFHKGRGSFGKESRDYLYNKNKIIFHDRWGDRFRRDHEEFKNRDPLAYLRERIIANTRQNLHAVNWD